MNNWRDLNAFPLLVCMRFATRNVSLNKMNDFVICCSVCNYLFDVLMCETWPSPRRLIIENIETPAYKSGVFVIGRRVECFSRDETRNSIGLRVIRRKRRCTIAACKIHAANSCAICIEWNDVRASRCLSLFPMEFYWTSRLISLLSTIVHTVPHGSQRWTGSSFAMQKFTFTMIIFYLLNFIQRFILLKVL